MRGVIYILACLVDTVAQGLFDVAKAPSDLPAGPYVSKAAAEEIHFLRRVSSIPVANDHG